MGDNAPDVNPGKLKQDTGQSPCIVSAARWLFLLLGVTWLVFGAWSIFRMPAASSNTPINVLWVISILMLANGLLLIWVGWGIGRGKRLYFFFGLLMLAGNIFLTFTDEFGAFDLVTLIINIVLLILLIMGRKSILEQ